MVEVVGRSVRHGCCQLFLNHGLDYWLRLGLLCGLHLLQVFQHVVQHLLLIFNISLEGVANKVHVQLAVARNYFLALISDRIKWLLDILVVLVEIFCADVGGNLRNVR